MRENMIKRNIKFVLILLITTIFSFLVNFSNEIYEYINFENFMKYINPKIISTENENNKEKLLNVIRKTEENEEIGYEANIDNKDKEEITQKKDLDKEQLIHINNEKEKRLQELKKMESDIIGFFIIV